MFDASQIIGFIAAVFVLVLVPGPNTMIILSQSIGGGRTAGLATVAGVELGTIVHTFAAALGLSALLSTSPAAFTVVKFAGACYLLIAGVRTLMQKPEEIAGPDRHGGVFIAFRRALFTNLLNPKVALFFLAFIPQFVRPERGHLFLQFVLLGLIVSLVGICFGSTLAIGASSIANWLRRKPGFVRWQQRITGGVLIALGVRLAFVRSQG